MSSTQCAVVALIARTDGLDRGELIIVKARMRNRLLASRRRGGRLMLVKERTTGAPSGSTVGARGSRGGWDLSCLVDSCGVACSQE